MPDRIRHFLLRAVFSLLFNAVEPLNCRISLSNETEKLMVHGTFSTRGMLAVVLCVTFSLTAAEPPKPAPAASSTAAEVPDWALGSFTIKTLSGMREKLVGYANKVVPNSGELGANVALNYVFSIPLNAGLKADGTALIYFVAPVTIGQPVEKAMVLPVSDPAALKAALAGSLGMPTDENGVLTYSIPQPLPNPDKLLVMKIVRTNLLVAPNAAVLRSLEDFLGARDVAALATDADIDLTLKMANVKRVFGSILTSSLESGALMAGQTVEQGEMLKGQVHNVLDALWQAETWQVRANFNSEKAIASLELLITGRAGTPLAANLTGDAPTLTGKLNTLLPFDPALLIAWNVNPLDSSGAVRNLVKLSNLRSDAKDDNIQARLTVLEALAGFLESAKGDAMLAVGARSGQPATPIVIVDTPDSKKTLAALVGFYQHLIEAINAESRVKNGKEFLSEEKAPDETIAGVPVIGRRLAIMGTTDNFMDDIFYMKMADLKHAVGIASGTGSHETFKAMVENATKPATVPSDVQALFTAIPKGTAALLMLRPLSVVRLVAAKANPDGPVEKLTAGLANPVLAVSVRVAEKTAALKIDIPADIPGVIYQLTQRLQRAGMQFDDLFKPRENAPAPPAP